jgi:hypothetical protein
VYLGIKRLANIFAEEIEQYGTEDARMRSRERGGDGDWVFLVEECERLRWVRTFAGFQQLAVVMCSYFSGSIVLEG